MVYQLLVAHSIGIDVREHVVSLQSNLMTLGTFFCQYYILYNLLVFTTCNNYHTIETC
jgi:hypothetical protein